MKRILYSEIINKTIGDGNVFGEFFKATNIHNNLTDIIDIIDFSNINIYEKSKLFNYIWKNSVEKDRNNKKLNIFKDLYSFMIQFLNPSNNLKGKVLYTISSATIGFNSISDLKNKLNPIINYEVRDTNISLNAIKKFLNIDFSLTFTQFHKIRVYYLLSDDKVSLFDIYCTFDGNSFNFYHCDFEPFYNDIMLRDYNKKHVEKEFESFSNIFDYLIYYGQKYPSNRRNFSPNTRLPFNSGENLVVKLPYLSKPIICQITVVDNLCYLHDQNMDFDSGICLSTEWHKFFELSMFNYIKTV